MSIKQYRPTTPARRQMTTADYSEITTDKPLKSLLARKNQKSGRNNAGKISVRHRGGGAKKHYRLVDFRMLPLKDGKLTLTIEEIEYDPNRSARIARVKDQEGVYHYILADSNMQKDATITVGKDAPIETSNRLTLEQIPVGSYIYAIELVAGKGAQLVRSAGSSAQLVAREGEYASVKMPSGEVRKIAVNAMASIGVVGNAQHQNISYGKAGRTRHRGIRPTVRGVVMNATDHPHGGGDGGRHGSGKPPRTPWGQLTLGFRTRNNKRTNKMIVVSRHNAKRGK
ncbi:MAG: 50S ribosomal protein L2 [Candidatus Nomurabacteria bacterium]|jgi:large subunit ribosomal protein L2|nr:50S ribosomal protein L2 [Candidatus Nomurabacteria bacterium]